MNRAWRELACLLLNNIIGNFFNKNHISTKGIWPRGDIIVSIEWRCGKVKMGLI
jgi:hypothetical protein